jgi:hypothetical protein
VRFEDVACNVRERYSLGIERETGRYYVAIPVSSGFVDYTEFYEIDADTFSRYGADLDSALPFVVRCRNRQEDARLMLEPGRNRGTAG